MAKSLQLFLLITGFLMGFLLAECFAQRQICSYYGSERKPKEAYSLSNCTWYRESSCCTRTEVTSSFLGMPHLATSSNDCRNRMNYMMCYFCSPDQHKWLKEGKVHICKSFCDDVYTHCKDAKYDGTSIGSTYSSGKGFCEAQFFQVVDKDCFEFDEEIFANRSLYPAVSNFAMVLVIFNLMKNLLWT